MQLLSLKALVPSFAQLIVAVAVAVPVPEACTRLCYRSMLSISRLLGRASGGNYGRWGLRSWQA